MDDEQPKDDSAEVGRWIKELTACREREKDFRTDGQRILDLYDGTKAMETPFNILYSNTETLMPALYSATPRPEVQRRFKDEDPLGKASSQAGKRMLEFLVDTNTDTYETYDDGMQQATLTALLPGRAFTAVKYDGPEGDAYEGETVCVDSKLWNRVYVGFAHRWDHTPWIAYEDMIDKAEAEKQFGKDVADLLTYSAQDEQDKTDDKRVVKEEPHQGETKLTRIYQIWDKDGGKQVRYVSEQVKDRFLKVMDDPLGLTGFFNCPKPLTFLKKPHSLLPTALYILYESQAKELNELTRRIKHITKAIRARALYDGELGDDLKKLMDADDAMLVPSDKSGSLAADKGMENAVWFWPVDKLIVVLRELYVAREQCKQVIYEITGISDIIRGASKASETLGAQEIKTQWGTLRLKRAQKEVARYARDLLRLMLEIAATKFNEETWAKMTGLPFLLSSKFNELTAIRNALKGQVQQMQAQMSPPQPGMAPPPMPPQVQQLQQIEQQLQVPQWKDVLALLQDDLQRSYRIDIETNSTVEPEAAEDQKMIQEVLMTLSQVLQGMGPLVVKGVLPFEAAQTLLLTIIRRYRFGTEIEDTIKQMQPPKPEDDGKAAEMAAMQQQMAQQQAQAQQQTAQQQLQVQAMTAEKQILEQKVDLQLREIQLKAEQESLARERQDFEKMKGLQQQVDAAKIGPEARDLERSKQQQERATEAMKAKIQQETELAKAKLASQTQLEVARMSNQAKVDQVEAQPGGKKQTDAIGILLKEIAKPRRKKAIRGADGRIEAVEDVPVES
jgi:hypothetical protein